MKLAIILALIGAGYFIFEWVVEKLEAKWPEEQHPSYFSSSRRVPEE